MEALIILLLLGAVAASVYFVAESRSGSEAVSVNREPRDIIALAVAQIPGGTASMRSSWMPAGHSERSASFVYKRRASILLALFLLICGIIPGIIYIAFGGKNQTLQVDVLSGASELTTVQIAASGGTARRKGQRFLKQLQAQTLTASPEAAVLPGEA